MNRCDVPWLRARGLVIAAGVFLVGSFIAWYVWVEQARQVVFNAPDMIRRSPRG